MSRYDYRIAAGWGVALGSLVNIETIVPTGDKAFYPPQSFGTYNPGILRVRGDGIRYLAGFPSVDWVWTGNPHGKLTYAQAKYLSDTYCNSGQSGKVTIYTKTRNSAAYERYNAIIVLPIYSEAGANFKVFTRFVVHMTHLVAL